MFSKQLVAASLQPIVLSILSRGEAYGYEIMQRALDLSEGKLIWTAWTLYPLMHRLEAKGLITSIWRPSESGPRRKYYRITTKGASELEVDKSEWIGVHSILMKLWGPELAIG